VKRPLGLAVMVAWTASSAAAAVLEGTVALPDEAAMAVKARYPVAATYEVGPADPPAAVVYVEGSFSGREAPEEEAVMAQSRYQFSPALLPVRRGAVVRFPNRDDEYHSVFSYSKTKRFDLGRYHKEETPVELEFDQPGVVKLYCEIHDHMRGTILVLDTPYFAKTDSSGRYRIEGVPAGDVVVKAWIGEAVVRERRVAVGPEGRMTVDFPAE
jgi:plastocyanin